jgi:hypothetical protein
MLGHITGVGLAATTRVGLHRERDRAGIDRGDGSAGAVVDVVVAVIAPRDHPLTHTKLKTTALQGGWGADRHG